MSFSNIETRPKLLVNCFYYGLIFAYRRTRRAVGNHQYDMCQVLLNPLVLLNFLALLHHPFLHRVLILEHYDSGLAQSRRCRILGKEYLQFASSSRVGPLVSG